MLADLLGVRLIMPWRLPDWANSTFRAVILKRFLAPDLVLIWAFGFLFRQRGYRPASTGDAQAGMMPGCAARSSCSLSTSPPPRQPVRRAAEAAVYGRAPGNGNRTSG